MMAGVLIISMLSGVAGTIAALVFSQPFWVALLAYPVAGMIAFLAVAILLGLRGSTEARQPEFIAGRLSPLNARPRH